MYRYLILFTAVAILVFLIPDTSHAAAMLYRVQQMRAQKQQREQEEYQQEMAAQQPQSQPASQAPAAPPTYQQMVDARNQALAQAILSEHNNAITTSGISPSLTSTANASSSIAAVPAPVDTSSNDVKDVVDMTEVWKKLDKNSKVWNLLIDDQAKLLTVSEYINRFENQGVKIAAPPSQYMQMIDQLSKQNPPMLERPFGELIQILAIMNYDFDNGMDKDELARKLLGEEGYEQNKKRFQ